MSASTLVNSPNHSAGNEEMLDVLQREAFEYFIHESSPINGLVLDKSREGWPASIAAIGHALAGYPAGVERGFITRDDAVQRTLVTLRFFTTAPHGPETDATGHKGFYYHFLESEDRSARMALRVVERGYHLSAGRHAGRRLLSEAKC